MIQTVDRKCIEELERQAWLARNKRARIVLSEHKDGVQEMVIALCADSYIRPHRHPAHKSESYHLMNGSMLVFIYEENGDVKETIPLCNFTPFYRLKNGWFHRPVALSPVAVYHEVLQGPFNKELDVQYADWAAEEV